MNLEGVALKLLLAEPDKDRALQSYSELRPEYFSEAFKSILKHIRDYYDDFGVIPSLRDLEVYRSRDKKAASAIAVLGLIDAEGIDLIFAVEELTNQYVQTTALSLIEDFLETISLQDRYELLESVSKIPLRLEEAIHDSDIVFSINNIDIFEEQSAIEANRMPSGISNQWDAEAGGYYKQELVLLGGKRGSGKSLICANLCVAQMEQGNVAVYFTIEMTAKEVMQRIIAIEARVPFSHLKQGLLSLEDKLKVCAVVASKYEGGDTLYQQWLLENPAPDFLRFEKLLKKSCTEKEVGKVIIIDDRDLSLATIDTKVSALKARYGDRLCMVVVDYINQIIVDGSTDAYDWKDQIIISKTLKNFSRKHDVCMVSPYQMDDAGKARFAQGILDACDVAQLIRVEDKSEGHIVFETTKARSATDTGKHRVLMDWVTLRVDPREVVVVEGDEPKTPAANSKEEANELGLS